MEKYISADVLTKSLKERRLICKGTITVSEALEAQGKAILEEIEATPAADVVPRSEVEAQRDAILTTVAKVEEIIKGHFEEVFLCPYQNFLPGSSCGGDNACKAVLEILANLKKNVGGE